MAIPLQGRFFPIVVDEPPLVVDHMLVPVSHSVMGRRIAKFKADRGIASSVQHADDASPKWSDVAVEYVRAYARHTETFMAEDVRAYATKWGFPDPPEMRAWGAVMRRAARENIIIAFGYAPANSSNRAPKVRWLSQLFKAAK